MWHKVVTFLSHSKSSSQTLGENIAPMYNCWWAGKLNDSAIQSEQVQIETKKAYFFRDSFVLFLSVLKWI